MTSLHLPEGADPADKAVWRSVLRDRRRSILRDEAGRARRATEGQLLRERLDAELATRGIGADALIAAFAPRPTEPDLMPWLRAATAAGRPLLLPVATGTETLDWVLWHGDSALDASPARGFGDEPIGERLGTEAIVRAAAILAPALAVDRSGTRLGHGGGFYDRALGLRSPSAPVLVVVHPDEVLPAVTLPRHVHDAPFDAAVTASGVVVPDATAECGTSRTGGGAPS